MKITMERAIAIRRGFAQADKDWASIEKYLDEGTDAYNHRVYVQTVRYRQRTLGRLTRKAYFWRITKLKVRSEYNFYDASAHAAAYGL